TEEFEAELASIGSRIDNLEGRIGFLEDNQFSTTTILNGEVIFGIADAFGGNPPGGCETLNLNLQNGATANAVNCGIREDDQAISTAGEPETETVFTYLARLGLQASFSGQDRLRMFLTTGNFDNGGFTNPASLNTYSPRLSYQAGLENQVVLDILEYRFPAFNDRVAFYASTFGFSLSNVLTANSPYFDIGRGAVSRFGQLNPIFRIGGPMDAGVGFDWLISDPVRLQVAYGTRDSSDPDGGFFGADHSALGAQILVQPTDNIVTGITYVNAYSSDGSLGTFTGSVNAETNGLWSGGRLPNPSIGDLPGGAFPGVGTDLGDFPAQINAVGGTFQWNFTPQLNFGASTAYTFSNFLEEIPEFDLQDNFPGLAGKKPFANTLTYQVSLGYADPFGREGDLFGFIFGMPPKLVDAGPVTPGQTVPFSEQVINNEAAVTVTDNDPRNFLTRNEQLGDPDNDLLIQEGTLDQFGREDEATSLHFEFFYRYKVNDNIWITPGFFFVTNPGHIADNDTLYVGTLRTTFRF
ncbi:MAG: iron uptake porin, partial [Pleurocapsa sp.]